MAATFSGLLKKNKIFPAVLTAVLSVSFFILPVSALWIPGDVDGNSRVESSDARLALRASVRLEDYAVGSDAFHSADVNGNGIIEASDARSILRASVSLETLPPAVCEHVWDDGVVTRTATCKDEGETTFTCTVCGEKKTEPIARTEDHVWDEGAVTKAVTCKDEGETTFTCTVCGEKKTEPIARTEDHVWDEGAVTRAATCKDEGETTFTCTVCGRKKTEPIAKTEEHVWDSGTVTKEGTLTEQTEIVFTCRICGVRKTEHRFSVTRFNEAVNVLKDGTHTYSGFTQTVSTAARPEFTGMMESMINAIPKKERERMMAEFTANEVSSTAFVRNSPINNSNFNLTGDPLVSRLTEGDVLSVTAEQVQGVDFLADLPEAYLDTDGAMEVLTPIKNTVIGDVIKVTVVLPAETEPKESAIPRIDSALCATIDESSDEIGKLAGEMDIFGENSMKLDVRNQAAVTVTYYFDAATDAPIAAHYDDAVTIDSEMDLYLNDDGTVSQKSTGSIVLKIDTESDSYYFFDDYFNL